MRKLASIVAGRRSKWLVFGVWVLAVFVVFSAKLPSKLSDKTTDATESFLPSSAESTQVVRDLEHQFPQGQTDTGLVVYKNAGGLTPANKARIAADAKAIQAAGSNKINLVEPPAVPFAAPGQGSPGALVSKDGTVAVMVLTTPTNFDKEGDWGKAVRDITDKNTGDMQVNVTGNLGFSADAKDVFSNIDTKLLLATVTLVLVLLGAIYRSALIAITPLIVVFFAYSIAQGLIYAYADSGATVSKNSTSILIVLMFGVGTDYCLLLVSRYREELRRIENKHDAMARAVRRAGPAILASGSTVALAMLVLALADNRGTSSLGPVAAIAVVSALCAGLTLLPALLTMFGRPGFWPRRRMVAYDPEHAADVHQGPWRRFGDRVLQRPAAALAGHRGPLLRGRARPPRLQGGLFEHQLLQALGRERLRLRRPPARVPGGDARTYDDPGAER